MRYLVLFLTLCLLACGKSNSDYAKQAQRIEEKNIGIKYEDFANNFNAKKTEYMIADKVEFTVKPDSDTATLDYKFNPTTAMRLKIDKQTHKIQEMNFLKALGGDDNLEKLQSVLDAPTLASIATQALNPTIPKEKIGKTVMDLFVAASEQHDIEQAAVINNVKYSAKFDSEFKSYLYTIKP